MPLHVTAETRIFIVAYPVFALPNQNLYRKTLLRDFGGGHEAHARRRAEAERRRLYGGGDGGRGRGRPATASCTPSAGNARGAM